MKKLVTVVVLLLSVSAFCQIKVIPTTPVEKLGRIGSDNDVYVQKVGNDYTFFYKNIENPTSDSYKRFEFKDLNGDYQNLYTLISEGFKPASLQDIKLDMPNDYVWLHYSRSGQKVSVQFMTTNKITGSAGISEFLSSDDINKLFGKL